MHTCRVCSQNYEEAMDTYAGTDYYFPENKTIHKALCCPNCGSWSIAHIPEDLEKYYPKDYYSYAYNGAVDPVVDMRAKNIIKDIKITEKACVLDWGAGSQQLIQALWNNGIGENEEYTKLVAYDPYAAPTIVNHLRLTNLLPTNLSFDAIVSSHSLEHETRPYEDVLKEMLSLLKKGGAIWIEVPISDSFGHMLFREKSVTADLPRHITVPSRAGLKYAADKVGLTISHLKNIAYGQHLIVDELLKSGKKRSDAEEAALQLPPAQATMYNYAAEWIKRVGMSDVVSFVLRRKS